MYKYTLNPVHRDNVGKKNRVIEGYNFSLFPPVFSEKKIKHNGLLIEVEMAKDFELPENANVLTKAEKETKKEETKKTKEAKKEKAKETPKEDPKVEDNETTEDSEE